MRNRFFLPIIFVLVNLVGCVILFYVWSSKMQFGWQIPNMLQPLIRLQGFLPGLFILSCFLYIWSRRPLKLRFGYEKALLAILALDVLWLFVGLINQNNLIYTLGDTYRLAVVPLVCFSCLLFYRPGLSVNSIAKILFYLLCFLFLVEFGLQLASVIIRQRPIIFSVDSFIVPLTFLLLKNKKRWYEWLFLLACAASALISLKRTNWVILVCIILFWIIIEIILKAPWRRLLGQLTKLTLVLMAVMAIIMIIWPGLWSNSVADLKARWYVTGLQDSSTVARYAETEAALWQMRLEGGPLVWLWGFGNGASWKNEFYPGIWDLQYPLQIQADAATHHIHNTFGAFIFRTGLIGLLLYLYFYFDFNKQVWRILRSYAINDQTKLYFKVLLIFMWLRFITSAVALMFWGDFLMAVAVALGSLWLRQQTDKQDLHI